jgi:hypothetical protein
MLVPRLKQAPDRDKEGGHQSTDSSKINRRVFLAPALPMDEGQKNLMKTSKKLLPTLNIGSHINAGPQPLHDVAPQSGLEGIVPCLRVWKYCLG